MHKVGLPPKKELKASKHGSVKVVYTVVQQIKPL